MLKAAQNHAFSALSGKEAQAGIPFALCGCVDIHSYIDFERRYIRMASVQKTMDSSSLAEVVDRILDKGIVVDAWARVSLVGIEILAVEARVVVASVDTYLKYAEAVGLTAAAAVPA